MPINSFLYPAPTNSNPYVVANSCRFNDDDSPDLSFAQGTPTDGSRWTWSGWVKRGNLSDTETFASSYNGTNTDRIQFNSNDQLHVEFKNGGSTVLQLVTTQVFRDVSAWYHIVVAFDSNLSQSNRVKNYVNGTQVTSFSTSTELTTSGYTTKGFNANSKNFVLGCYESSSKTSYYDGYMAEVVFVDGQALTPTSFGEFDEDSPTIWKPIDVSGLTFGTNGFYLDFEDSSALGNDVSGNNNDFTVNNLTSIDQNKDTCTNNWCTQNPLSYRQGQTVPTYSEGNLKVVYAAGVNTFSYGTLGVQAGKWYWEVKVTFGSNVYTGIGFDSAATNTDINGYLLRQTGQIYNTSGSASSYASALSTGDIVMVAFDADNGTLWFGVNGTWSNSATQTEIENGTTTNSAFSGIDMSSIWLPLSKGGTSSNSNTQSNFGNEIYSISSGNADANGFGNFEYAVPSGYFALCSKNLAEYG